MIRERGWHDAPAVFDDYEPYTGAVYANAPDCGAEEANVAVSAAQAAFSGWADTPPADTGHCRWRCVDHRA